MDKESALDLNADPHLHIAPTKVWGGNCRVERNLRIASLSAWVSCQPFPPGDCGGDVYVFSSCRREVTIRAVLADVSGHGTAFSQPAESLRRLVADHIEAHDQTELMGALNADVLAAHQKYATAVVIGFHRYSENLVFTNAGHPPALWFQASTGEWHLLHHETEHSVFVEDLPVGLIEGTSYSQTAVRFGAGDLLVLYTDGFAEATDPAGNELGYEGLLKLATRVPTDSPAECGRQLISEVTDFCGRPDFDDDCSLIVLKRNA